MVAARPREVGEHGDQPAGEDQDHRQTRAASTQLGRGAEADPGSHGRSAQASSAPARSW